LASTSFRDATTIGLSGPYTFLVIQAGGDIGVFRPRALLT
jgi:hypothetical protein